MHGRTCHLRQWWLAYLPNITTSDALKVFRVHLVLLVLLLQLVALLLVELERYVVISLSLFISLSCTLRFTYVHPRVPLMIFTEHPLT